MSSSDHTSAPLSPIGLARPTSISSDESRAVFGQVMGLVALAVGLVALGASIGRDLSGGWGIAFLISGFACLIGMNVAVARDRQQLTTTLLGGLGLLLGLGLGPVLVVQPAAGSIT